MLIGIVSDFVLHPQHEEWIADKMETVIKRGVDKNAEFIVMSYIGGSLIKHMSGQNYYVISHSGWHNFKHSLCTFKADVDFLIDMSDLVIIISNGGVQTEWQKIRESDVDRVEINYLTRKEKKYARIL